MLLKEKLHNKHSMDYAKRIGTIKTWSGTTNIPVSEVQNLHIMVGAIYLVMVPQPPMIKSSHLYLY